MRRHRSWFLLALAALLLGGAACRHIPTKECRQACEAEQDACREKGNIWWTCQERVELCLKSCPSAP